MSNNVGQGLTPPPGGVQSGDYVLLIRPGNPAGVYGLPNTPLTADSLAAIAATLPTTAPTDPNAPWLNGGVLTFGPVSQTTPPPTTGGNLPRLIDDFGNLIADDIGEHVVTQ